MTSTDPLIEAMARVTDKTDLRFWFPLIEKAGLPVPQTIIVDMPRDTMETVIEAFDGKSLGSLEPFLSELGEACDRVGYPAFLRTSHTSGKHGWDATCFVSARERLLRHVMGIVEYSEMAGLMGLPWGTWVVREFLPTEPTAVCPQYGNMPVCAEFRVFVDGADVICFHPYWPLDSLRQGGLSDVDAQQTFDKLCRLTPDDETEIKRLASQAGAACGGAWSVDILATARGWFVTDMAEAHKSFHWAGCDRLAARPRVR